MEEIITVKELEKDDLNLVDIAKQLNVSEGTVRIYLSRDEFNFLHDKRIRFK